MIVFPKNFKEFNSRIGGKTKNLKILMDSGFNVPRFVAIPTHFNFSKESVEKVAEEILKDFSCDLYAVRSSALIEDGREHSFAGQFKTRIAVKPEYLVNAISEVLEHAKIFLKGDLNKFSLIVQDYIEADYAGICFTRNPIEGREMVIEYNKGIGEKIVGGEIRPEKMSCYWHQSDLNCNLPEFKEAIAKFQHIESLFYFPQDIEWCVKNGRWYFLQSRSITTKTREQWEHDLYLDKVLPKDRKFYFEKTEISEIAPRPTPITLALLRKIYSDEGAIEKVYKRYGIKYIFTDFLNIVGNELYADREKEIKSILPSYSYFRGDYLKPRMASLKGFFCTIGNLFALNRLSLSRYEYLSEIVKEKLEKAFETELPVTKALNMFMQDYETIFEVNLLTQKAVSKLEYALRKEGINITEILSEHIKSDLKLDDANYIGNCLEIADETEFKRFGNNGESSGKVKLWLNNLPPWKKKYLEPIIKMAQQFSGLREYGRYLTVKDVSQLRLSLFKEAENHGFKDKRNIFFTSFRDIEKKNLSEEICKKSRVEFDCNSKFLFSTILTSKPIDHNGKTIGVSGGKAGGKLLLADSPELETNILYTKILSPDLTKYFGKIKGIVSESGGLLSHLAIMARENNIPVIVGFNLQKSGIKIGEVVEIDGDTGKINSLI